MKKILKTAAAAVAGMLAFGLAACTDGNDEYKPEEPTTYYEADKDYAGSGIAAKWDFTGLSSEAAVADTVWGLTTSEAEFAETGFGANGGLKQADGTESADATLVPFGAWKRNQRNGTTISDKDGVAQSKNSNSSNLDKYDESAGFKLTLTKQANIVVKARGAGAAAPTRFVLITKGNDKLVYKANLRNTKAEEFVVKGAAPGEYNIYVNGSCVYYVDLSVDSKNLKKPAQVTELKLYQGDVEAPDAPSFAEYDTVKFTVYDVKTPEEKNPVTTDAIWTSSDKNVATVTNGVVTGTGEGTAVIRARIGRFYDERTVKVTKNTKTIIAFISGDKLPTDNAILVDKDNTKTVADFLAAEELKPLLEPVVLGVVDNPFAEAKTATLTFNSAFTFLEGKDARAGFLPKGKYDDGDGTFGLYWRSNSYDPTASSGNSIEEATFTFKVKPTGASAKLSKLTALTHSNKGSAKHRLQVSIGDKVFTVVGFNKPAANTEINLEDFEITAETEIKVSVIVMEDKTRTAIQDLRLFIAE